MKNKVSIISLTLSLTACNLVPDFHRPNVETPAQWHDASLSRQKSTVDPHWWQAFGSAELNRLITEALIYNNDLAAAKQ
ncbi:MAG: efflux transporter outer membrane subunit, partial [Methylobacter sp.]